MSKLYSYLGLENSTNAYGCNGLTAVTSSLFSVKYTISNSSDKNFDVDNLNNFYLTIDGKNYNNDVRANLYAKQSINGYVELDSVPAGGEIENYVGFVVPADTSAVICGYYVTSGEKTDKQDTIICEVKSSEWIQPPEGMLK